MKPTTPAYQLLIYIYKASNYSSETGESTNGFLINGESNFLQGHK